MTQRHLRKFRVTLKYLCSVRLSYLLPFNDADMYILLVPLTRCYVAFLEPSYFDPFYCRSSDNLSVSRSHGSSGSRLCQCSMTSFAFG